MQLVILLFYLRVKWSVKRKVKSAFFKFLKHAISSEKLDKNWLGEEFDLGFFSFTFPVHQLKFSVIAACFLAVLRVTL